MALIIEHEPNSVSILRISGVLKRSEFGDMQGTRTKKLVFRGTGTPVIGGPDSNASKIEEAVEKMVETLPTKR